MTHREWFYSGIDNEAYEEKVLWECRESNEKTAVGFWDARGKWHRDSLWVYAAEAVKRAEWLNGPIQRTIDE